MPYDINSFGPGGEALSGLFMGQQAAQAEEANNIANQKTLADIANTAAITRQRELGNQFEETLQPDKIAAERLKYKQAQEADQISKYERSATAMSKMGAMLSNVPPAARPAAIQQMATAYGIGQDNPMLSHMMNMDPNELPGALENYSKHLYEQGDEARKTKQTKDADMARAEMERRSAEKIAGGNNATTLEAARIAAASRENVAGQRAGGGGKDPLAKLTIDQRISYLENKNAVEGLSDPEQTALDNLKRFKLGQATVGKSGAAAQMGLEPEATTKIEDIIRGGPTKPGAAKGTPQISSKAEYDQLPSGAKYLDPQGNVRTKK